MITGQGLNGNRSDDTKGNSLESGDFNGCSEYCGSAANTSTNNVNYGLSVAALCLCSLANAFNMISVYPYAGFMVLALVPGTTTESAGTFAGLLASSFMVGRFVTALEWGRIADKYGRIFVLQVSLVLSAVFCVLFGLSLSYRMALVWRCCLGATNVVASTTKTLASEISNSETQERRAMGLVVGMRSWGLLLGPALGGFFAEPLKQYDAQWLYELGVFTQIMDKYPFLLPNVVVAFFCLLSAGAVTFIEETLPENQRTEWRPGCIGQDLAASVRRYWSFVFGCCCPPLPLTTESATCDESTCLLPNHDNHNSRHQEPPTSPLPPIWSRLITRKHFVAHWIFSFVVAALDEAFPLFCLSTVGGLALTEVPIGQLLSSAGVFFAIFHYCVYAAVVDKFGLYPSIEIGCFFGLIPAALIPVSVLFRDNYIVMFGFLSLLLGICKIMACIVFSSLAIATNKTVPASQRAKMNAIVLVGGSVTKGLGPIFAGYLCTVSFSSQRLSVVPPEYGSIIVFSSIAILGLVVFNQLLHLEKKTKEFLRSSAFY